MSIDVRFRSLTGRRYHVYVLADPALSNNGDDDTGACSNSALVATDAASAAALIAQPAFTRASCGYKGTSDGWTDLSEHHRMAWDYASAPSGNVVQAGRTQLTGLRGHRAADARARLRRRRQRRDRGRARVAGRRLRPAGRALRGRLARLPRVAQAPARAASPPLPSAASTRCRRWCWRPARTRRTAARTSPLRRRRGRSAGGTTRPRPYHLVWSRDLYQIGTGLITAGDTAGARTGPSTTCSASSRNQMVRSHRIPGWTAPRSGAACSSTR